MSPRLHGLLVVLGVLVASGCAEEDDVARIEPGEERPGGDTTNALLLGSNAFLPPASNISVEHEALFFSGNSFFNQAWVEAPSSTQNRDGLGPLFNARSCSGCHFRDGRGAPPDTGEPEALGLLLRLSVGNEPDGAPTPHPVYGGQFQPFGTQNTPGEGRFEVRWESREGAYLDGTPYTLREPVITLTELAYGPLDEETLVSPRLAPQMIGMGLLEATPAERLEALADPDDLDGDGVSGRIAYVPGPGGERMVGRFGWKAEAPTVRAQTAGAFAGDMGLTTPEVSQDDCTDAQAECEQTPSGGEPEVPEHIFERVVLYSSMLAVPQRRDWRSRETLRGKRLFAEAGCAACHTPSHVTGEHATLPELSHQVIWPYTDLLLHDMGGELADGRPVWEASGQEWRTPPLWGVGLLSGVNGNLFLMHDGRARSIAEAILWHGGEGASAREAFRAMGASERDALVHFVSSL